MVDTRVRQNIHDSIELQPWCILKSAAELGANNGKQYLVKYFFDKAECGYKIMLYDGIQLWHEELTRKIFEDKCKKFNPNIEANSSSLLEKVQSSLKESLQSKMTIEKNNGCIEAKMKSKLQAGIPFTWTFLLKPAIIELLSEHITGPLNVMVVELFRRQKELIYMLERKDREIQDYKDQGTVVSRKHLQTIPFDRNAFENTSNLNEEFLNTCTDREQAMTSLSCESVCEMNRHVQINTQTVRITAGGEGGTGESSTSEVHPSAFFDTVPVVGRSVSSWTNDRRVPGSVVNDNVDGKDDPNKQQDVEKSEAVSPKNVEKARREALRRRLDDENERKSKKKKKKIYL